MALYLGSGTVQLYDCRKGGRAVGAIPGCRWLGRSGVGGQKADGAGAAGAEKLTQPIVRRRCLISGVAVLAALVRASASTGAAPTMVLSHIILSRERNR